VLYSIPLKTHWDLAPAACSSELLTMFPLASIAVRDLHLRVRRELRDQAAIYPMIKMESCYV
jgi:hypothetical protein